MLGPTQRRADAASRPPTPQHELKLDEFFGEAFPCHLPYCAILVMAAREQTHRWIVNVIKHLDTIQQ